MVPVTSVCNFSQMEHMWLWPYHHSTLTEMLPVYASTLQSSCRVFACLLSQWMFGLWFSGFSTWRKLSRSVHMYGFKVIWCFSLYRYILASSYIISSAMDDKVSFLFQYPKLSETWGDDLSLGNKWIYFVQSWSFSLVDFRLLWSMATKLKLDSDHDTWDMIYNLKYWDLCSLKFEVLHSDLLSQFLLQSLALL